HALRARGDLTGAAAAFQQSVLLQPGEARRWENLALAQLTVGDRTAYRGTCAELLQRFGQTRKPDVAATVLSVCLAAPNAIDDMEQLIALGEVAASDKAQARFLGAALYRAGRHADAVQRLQEAGQLVAPRAADLLFLAMAHHQLGHRDTARGYFDEAVRQLEKARYVWPEQKEAELLHREAQTLLGQNESAVPVSKRKQATGTRPSPDNA